MQQGEHFAAKVTWAKVLDFSKINGLLAGYRDLAYCLLINQCLTCCKISCCPDVSCQWLNAWNGQ